MVHEIFRLIIATFRDDSLKMTIVKSFFRRNGFATTEMRLFEPNGVPVPVGFIPVGEKSLLQIKVQIFGLSLTRYQ